MQRNPERGKGARGGATVAVGSDSKVYLHLTLNTLPESATTTASKRRLLHTRGEWGCCGGVAAWRGVNMTVALILIA